MPSMQVFVLWDRRTGRRWRVRTHNFAFTDDDLAISLLWILVGYPDWRGCWVRCVRSDVLGDAYVVEIASEERAGFEAIYWISGSELRMWIADGASSFRGVSLDGYPRAFQRRILALWRLANTSADLPVGNGLQMFRSEDDRDRTLFVAFLFAQAMYCWPPFVCNMLRSNNVVYVEQAVVSLAENAAILSPLNSALLLTPGAIPAGAPPVDFVNAERGINHAHFTLHCAQHGLSIEIEHSPVFPAAYALLSQLFSRKEISRAFPVQTTLLADADEPSSATGMSLHRQEHPADALPPYGAYGAELSGGEIAAELASSSSAIELLYIDDIMQPEKTELRTCNAARFMPSALRGSRPERDAKLWRAHRKAHEGHDKTGLLCENCDQLQDEDESPLLYSNRDETCEVGKTSSTKYKL